MGYQAFRCVFADQMMRRGMITSSPLTHSITVTDSRVLGYCMNLCLAFAETKTFELAMKPIKHLFSSMLYVFSAKISCSSITLLKSSNHSVNNTSFIALPLCFFAHTTHVLQLLDVRCFGPVAYYYRRGVENLSRVGVKRISKHQFVEVYMEVYIAARSQALCKKTIKSVFRQAGLFPFNLHRIMQQISGGP